MSERKVSICRVCLSPVKKKCTSLFEEYKNSAIYKHINTIANVEIKENDGLPNKICADCLLELDTVVNFKQKCESSNIILQSTSLNPASSSLEVDIKDVVVKKEESQEEEKSFLDCDTNYFDSDLYDIDEDKPLKYIVSKSGVIKKSRAIDLHLQCDDCKQFFRTKCKLRVHWKKVHLTENLKCQNCKRNFKSFKAFNRHQRDKSKSCANAGNFRIEGEGKHRTFHCKECEYKSVRIKDMITHWVIHTGDRPFKCDLCSTTCTQQSSLDAHKESVHKQYRTELTCHFCGKYLRGRNRIYRHLKMHTSKAVQCTVCSKMLKNKNSLSVHMQRHSGVKSFTCEICATNFYTSAELSNHRRMVHLKHKRWFNCDLCSYKSHRPEAIKKHKGQHTETNIPCTVCGMFFDETPKLIKHQRRHFAERRHACPHCELKFVRRDSLTKHIKVKHKCVQLINPRPLSLKQENRVVVLITENSADLTTP